MKTTIDIPFEYNAAFLGVGRKIANGEPPPWLLIGLTHFSESIGINVSDVRERMKSVIDQMQHSVDVLTKWLPIYQNLPFGWQCPHDVSVVLEALPRIKNDLERLSHTSGGGQPPKTEREVCAAVIVEAWKLVHGNLNRLGSLTSIYEACDEYWRACGGERIGEDNDPKNWRRPVEYALANDHAWVRVILETARN
jgi:hypothetical protein